MRKKTKQTSFEQHAEENADSAADVLGVVRLSEFVENPDNPQTVSDKAFARLVEKLKRIPSGLTAKRIAFVTDHPAGRRVVISGNKRLRALKQIHGVDYFAPLYWFQDVTEMSAEQRREFIVTENVVEGEWIESLLSEMFTKDELEKLMDDEDVADILSELPSVQILADNKEIDIGDFKDEMELKVKLTVEDRDKAIKVLSQNNAGNMGESFMSLLIGGEK